MKKSKRNKAVKSKNKKQKGKKGGLQIFFVVGLLMAGVLIASTVLLLVGMLPTIVALFVDRTRQKNKAITVGSVNLAGCTPFLIQLWSEGHTLDKAISIISEPMAIVVMFSAAAVGYIVDWAITGLVSNLLYERGKKRVEKIKKKQAELVERWGKEVTGELVLDEYGFAIEQEPKVEALKKG